MDSVDNTIDLETPQTLVAPQPKPALSFPIELWNDIIDFLDIDSLYSVRQTCVALSTLVRPRLIKDLVLSPPLDDLYTLTKKNNPDLPFYERVFCMHLYVDDMLGEPEDKWARDSFDWDGNNPKLLAQENSDRFCRHNLYKRGARSREWGDWNRWVSEDRCMLRRQLARVWAADGRFFPFAPKENKKWKRQREARGIVHPVISGQKVDFKRRGLEGKVILSKQK